MTIGSSLKTLSLAVLALFICVSLPRMLSAKEASVGKVVFVNGEATVTRLPDSQPKPLVFNDRIYRMDILQTGEGTLKVLFTDRSMLSLSPHSKVIVTEHMFSQAKNDRKSVFDIVAGNVRTIVQQFPNMKRNDVTLVTKAAVAGIRGTDVITHVGKKKGNKMRTQFLLDSGLLDVYSRDHAGIIVQVKPGQFVETMEGEPPSMPVDIAPDLRQKIFSSSAVLSEVLKQLAPAGPPASRAKAEDPSAVTHNIGDTETNPGSKERLPGSEIESPEKTPDSAPVKIPVRFE